MEGKVKKTQPKLARWHSWRTLIGGAAVTLLLVGAISAITMRGEPTILKAQVAGRNSNVSKDSSKTTEAGVQKSRHYVTKDPAGQTVVLDRQTGQLRPLTSEEAITLAEGIKQLVNQSTEGLVQVRRADGSVSMNLQGRFQDVLIAKKESDGTVSQSCINNLESAADFFEIDPALLGIAAPVSKSQPSSAKLPIY